MKQKIYFALLIISFITAAESIEAACSVTISPNPITVCTGNCTTLAAMVTGVSPFIYRWSTGSTSSTITVCSPFASFYAVTITDSTGCASRAGATVTVNTSPTVSISPDVAICEGSSTQLSAAGGVSCSWSPNAGLSDPNICSPICNPFVTTAYTVTITDANGCTNTGTTVVTVNPGPPPIPVIMNPSICIGSTIQLSMCFLWGTTYSWYPSTGLSDPNICNPFCNDTVNQTYVLTIWDVNGCSESTSLTVNAYPPPCSIGINEVTDDNSVSIYPNPFTNSFTLTINGIGNEKNIVLHIYNVLGEEVRTVAVEKEQTVISRKEMADGIYFYRIAQNGLAVHSGKLVVQ